MKKNKQKHLQNLLDNNPQINSLYKQIGVATKGVQKKHRKLNASINKMQHTLDMVDIAEKRLQNFTKNIVKTVHESMMHLDTQTKDEAIKKNIEQIKSMLQKISHTE